MEGGLAAKYELRRVQDAAREERISLDERRARDELGLHFRTLVEGYAFAVEALLALRPDDYCDTVSLGPPHDGVYDVYGVRVARPGLPGCWYLKFKLEEGLYEESVFFVSIHPLEKPMVRVGGLLKPEGAS